jgi:acetyl esterase/lipase
MFCFCILASPNRMCKYSMSLERVFVLAFAIAICSNHAMSEPVSTIKSNSYVVTVHTNLTYGSHPDQVLDLCKSNVSSVAFPVLILIHGGGWTGGDKSAYADLCGKYASMGIAAAAVNYRLFNRVTKANRWPSQIVDVQLAVRWLRANSKLLNLNDRKICAYGDSAGGHLALLLGSLPTTWPSPEAFSYPAVSSSVTCVVSNFAPSNLPESALPLLNTAKDLIGAQTAAELDHALVKASPLFYVNSLTAPTLIVQGSHDTLVPKSQSTSIRDAMLLNGVEVEYLEYDGEHQYKNLSPKELKEVSNRQVNFVIKHLKQ